MKIELEVNGSVVQVGLDKMVLGIPYPKAPKGNDQSPATTHDIEAYQSARDEFHANMKHIQSTIQEVGPCHCSKTQNKDLKRYMVLSEVDGSLLCVFSLGFSYGTGVINFEVNPSAMTTDKWAELLGLVDVLFYNGYDELYTKGVVSHAEFYVDVAGEDLANLVLIDEGRRTTTRWKGTTYHGRRCSRHVATMYDKANEQKQKGKLVRIEARINRRDIRFQDLVENDLFNPFGNLLVVDVNRVHLVAQEMNAPKLANHIIELGLYGAVANKPAREAILYRLKASPVDWWAPELFWAGHREQLQYFRPGSAGDHK